MKQFFRYAYGRRETDADQPMIREQARLSAIRNSGFKVLIMFLARSLAFPEGRELNVIQNSRFPTQLS